MSAKARRAARDKTHRQRILEKKLRRVRRSLARPGAAGAAAAVALGLTGLGTAEAADRHGHEDPSGGARPGQAAVGHGPSGDASATAAMANGVGIGTTYYFVFADGGTGYELWRSDGTPAGTVMVKDIDPGVGSSYPLNLTAVAGTLYFSADGGTGRELWKSDGTAAGTVLVKDINPGTYGGYPRSGYPSSLTAVGSTLYFSANDGTGGRELWKSDGSAAGTVLVKDINPGASSGGYPRSSYPSSLTAMGAVLYFSADDGVNGDELWRSDGTSVGTVLVKDIAPGTDGGYPYSGSPSSLTAMGGVLYFSADDGANGDELWKSDGTSVGTVLVKDITPGGYGAGPYSLTAVGGVLYFTDSDGSSGRELWKSDGSAAGTTLVKDIRSGPPSSSPYALTAVGGVVYFSANDGSNGYELWRSDGSSAGTTIVKDIRLGAVSSGAFDLTPVGDTLFFDAQDGSHGYELWKSDGTDAGTTLVKDIAPGIGNGYPYDLAAVGGTLFFNADSGNGTGLWKSDGTADGTVQLLAPDTTPPNTTIDSGPASGSTITTSSATFGFSGTPGDTAGFQCRIDGGAFDDCTSPHTFTRLGNGNHTVAFRAFDAVGNVDPTPAQRTFTVNTTVVSPPANKFKAPASGKANTKKGTLTLKVGLPGAGTLSLAPVGKSPVKAVKVTTAKAGAAKITIKPTKKGMKKLEAAKNGKLKVKVQLTFTPTGGAPYSQTKSYTLILR